MDYVLAKIKSRKGTSVDKHKKLLSDTTLYAMDINSISSIPYSSATSIDADEWFEIRDFSRQEYCLDILRSPIESLSFQQFENEQFSYIEYICACQNSNEYHFQKVSKSNLIERKTITLGDVAKYKTGDKCIVVHEIPDAIYLKDKDSLLFKNLSAITNIFKGIDQLYREATESETKEFLQKEFITLGDNFTSSNVKKPNRKRIALALETLNSFDKNQKTVVFSTVKEYCPNLIGQNGTFKIESDEDLKYLLWGIEQRFYTTPDGREKRIANSVITIN
ncbi:MAG: ATP F0F1 synthase synthase [Ruminococcaceae bacterium]|nr:ATP F0F1 synthase synthase [Oscillospiraceae bacterium]